MWGGKKEIYDHLTEKKKNFEKIIFHFFLVFGNEKQMVLKASKIFSLLQMLGVSFPERINSRFDLTRLHISF